jgi:CheY-like chemotaxis protein
MKKRDGLACILLVDDDEATNFLNTRVIKKLDATVKVQVAYNGREALDYLKPKAPGAKTENCQMPSLIFLDINMPGMDGWEFLEEYRKLPDEQTNQIKILMLTTSMNPDEEKRAMEIPEVKGFINKPLTPEKLERIINVYVF